MVAGNETLLRSGDPKEIPVAVHPGNGKIFYLQHPCLITYGNSLPGSTRNSSMPGVSRLI
jgi:hypothetical protein